MRIPLFLLIGAFVAVFSVASYSQQPTHNNQQPAITKNQNSSGSNVPSNARTAPGQMISTPDSKNSSDETDKENNWYYIFTRHLTEWLLVLFNGLLALFTWRLYIATNALVAAAGQQSTDTKDAIKAIQDTAVATAEANRIAKKAMLASDRPWLGVDSVGSLTPPVADAIFPCGLIIRNTGKAPAVKAQVAFYGRIIRAADGEPPLYAKEHTAVMANQVVMPNGFIQYNPFYGTSTLSQDGVNRIYAGIDKAWIVGRIDYFDAAGKSHVTTCRYWYVPESNWFTASLEGNHAD